MSELPDRRGLTFKEIYAIYSQGKLPTFSTGYLQDRHWCDDSGKPVYPIGIDDDGDLVWLPDSSGRVPVVEASTAAVLAALMDGATSAAAHLGSIVTLLNDVHDAPNHALQTNEVP